MRAERGQAQIEAVAAICVIALVGAIGVKSAAVVHAVLVVDAAVHAGALSQAAGGDAARAARRALPRAMRSASSVRAAGGTVAVEAPLGGRIGPIGARAWSRVPRR